MSKQELSKTLSDERECDREPIHLFASIQPHGVLLAFSPEDLRVQIVSENVEGVLGLPMREVMGARLDQLFQGEFVDELRRVTSERPWSAKGRHLNLRARRAGQIFDAFLYESEGLFSLELELSHEPRERIETGVVIEQTLRDFALNAKECKTLVELSQLVCVTFRRITGLDRVMMYRFLSPNWNGEVIAEDRVAHAHAYLGHRFPASDIPRPARDLYLRNQVRLIPDANVEAVPLTPRLNPKTKRVFDLSDSRLRSVAKIHLEYLKNMAVGASFSVSVTHQQELWALITCHHLTPIHLSQSQRTACEIVANIFSIQAPLLENAMFQNERLDFEVKLRRILESLRLSANPLDHFFKQHRTVTGAFEAHGMALVDKGLVDFAGLTPRKSETEDLAVWLREIMSSENKAVLAYHDLSERDPRWASFKDVASGVLAVRIPEVNDSLLLIFRPELVRTIMWGGDPRKQLDKRDFQGTIHPRASFEAWNETVKDQSKPWSRFEIEGVAFLRDFVFDGLVRKEKLIRELTENLRQPSL